MTSPRKAPTPSKPSTPAKEAAAASASPWGDRAKAAPVELTDEQIAEYKATFRQVRLLSQSARTARR